MDHTAIKIRLKDNVIQIEFSAADLGKGKKSIPALAKKVAKKGLIPPEFVIQVLARAILADKGQPTVKQTGELLNW